MLLILSMVLSLIIVHLITAPAKKGNIEKQIKAPRIKSNIAEAGGPVEVEVPLLGTMRVVIPKEKRE